VTLDTTNGGAVPTGANVTITGPVNDDVVGTTTFVVDGGAAGDVDLQGAVGAGTAVAALSATAGGLELDGATAAGDVSLVSSLADIILTGVQSGGLVLINSAGAILDGGEAVTDVIAPDLELLAQSGIGASADHLEIDADTVAADTTSGGIYLDDVAGGLTIGAVDVTEGAAVTDGNPDDAIYITAHSPLHINADVTNVGGGRIELDAAGTAEQDDLIVAADVKLTTTITGQIQLEAGSEVIILGLVQTEGGDVAANSGDQIIVNGGAIQTGAGAVDLSAPNDVQVTGGSNIISQSGSIAVTSQANLTVTGNVASDSGDVVLTATGDQLSLLGSVTSAAGEVQLVAGDTIVVEGSVSSGGDITLSSGDRISLGPASTIESQSGDAFLVAFDLDAEPGSTVIAPQGMVKISKPLNLDIVIPATAATQIAALLSGAHGSAGATTLASSGAGEVQDGTSGTPEGEEKEKKKKEDEETS
ncbi:MAG: hypothetical protein J7M08_02180, partial [Planctomycetes bacterium]|nr:hypothetical protein [Planctomycetota bacterium]